MMLNNADNSLSKDKHILFVPCVPKNPKDPLYQRLINDFYGDVLFGINLRKTDLSGKIVYTIGNAFKYIDELIRANATDIRVIIELSTNYELLNVKTVTLGEVPVYMFDVGVFFPRMFTPFTCFKEVTEAHKFQNLTESNKPGVAHRTGIYITNVEEKKSGLEFRLLRCSTNLTGPTDNLRVIDHAILTIVNKAADEFFDKPTNVNHVLAQVYHNSRDNKKERKAKIARHSDKTKDMCPSGILAFCTFYDKFNINGVNPAKADRYDYRYNQKTTVLTKLRFKLKPHVSHYEKSFDVLLYPGSLFMIPLSMNRIYTHEIIPSVLPIAKIPTRLGYVCRCSTTIAVHRDGDTYITSDTSEDVKMRPPIKNEVAELKKKYLMENKTVDVVKYGQTYFSLNMGDYEQPIL